MHVPSIQHIDITIVRFKTTQHEQMIWINTAQNWVQWQETSISHDNL